MLNYQNSKKRHPVWLGCPKSYNFVPQFVQNLLSTFFCHSWSQVSKKSCRSRFSSVEGNGIGLPQLLQKLCGPGSCSPQFLHTGIGISLTILTSFLFYNVIIIWWKVCQYLNFWSLVNWYLIRIIRTIRSIRLIPTSRVAWCGCDGVLFAERANEFVYSTCLSPYGVKA